MVKKKYLLFILLIMITGCSRADLPSRTPDTSVLPALTTARGMITLLRRSKAPLAAAGIVDIVPAAWLTGKIAEGRTAAVSFDQQRRRLTLDETGSNPALGIISIGGHVVNASGGIPPQNTFVDLTIYEKEGVVSQIKIPLDRTGVFRFDLVPWNPVFTYQVSTTFNDLSFASGLIDGNTLLPGTLIEIPILVYDSSTNTDLLRAIRMKVMYDFSTPGWVHVSENILITNPTSLVIVPAGDTIPVLNYVLPKGAVDVTFPDAVSSNRYRLTTTGFGDWEPVMPGNGHQVMVQYSVPFTSTWHCELNTPIPLDSLMVVVKASGLDIASNGFQLHMTQNDPENATEVYTASELSAGEKYALVFSTRDAIQKIWIGIAFFAITLISALIWMIWSRRQREAALLRKTIAENPENGDTILDAIIALDDRFKHGDISSAAYDQTRSELVEKLETLKKHNKG